MVAAFAAAATLTRIAAPECVRAPIGGRVRCLRVGLPCERRYERIYRTYAFTCKRARDGRLRLRVYNFIGPVNP